MVSLVGGGIGWYYFNKVTKMTERDDFLYTPLYTWNKISMNQPAICSDGSPYSIYSKKGNSKHLIIYFSGGGVCWDDPTCTTPIQFFPAKKGYYFPNVPTKLLAYKLKGITEVDRDGNPFKDWNLAFIPYCSGDFHIGNAINKYKTDDGDMEEFAHMGQSNIIAAFNWIFVNFPDPDRILITGESAGGFGNMFWTQAIAKNYPNVPIYQFADCSWGDAAEWPKAVKLWNSETEKVFGYGITEDIFGDALLYTAQKFSDRNITYLQANTLSDEVLTDYFWQLNDLDPETTDYRSMWTRNMINAVNAYDDSLDNYYYYITDWGANENGETPHTFLNNERFYQCEEDGAYLMDWLSKAVNEDQPFSVGEEFLNIK